MACGSPLVMGSVSSLAPDSDLRSMHRDGMNTVLDFFRYGGGIEDLAWSRRMRVAVRTGGEYQSISTTRVSFTLKTCI